MMRIISLIALTFFLGVSSAQEEKRSAVVLRRVPGKDTAAQLKPRSILERQNQVCEGTCTECYGSTALSCPGSTIQCYLPGDPVSGIESCSESDSGATTSTVTGTPVSVPGSTVSSAPTSTSSTVTTNHCFEQGGTCVSCFGEGFIDCGDGMYCYDPNDPYSICPSSVPNPPPPGGTVPPAPSCADSFGAGSVPCGDGTCYNPGLGETCCAQGYYCPAGKTCSNEVGYCQNAGGGGGLTSSVSPATSSGRSTAAGTGTATGSGSSATPTTFPGAVSSGSGSISGASAARGQDLVTLKAGAMMLGVFGVVVLAL